MPISGDPLVPAAPCGPRQDTLHTLLGGQHETPEEASNLRDTQRHRSPRVALKAARLLGMGWDSIFFGASSLGSWVARSPVNNA